MLIICGGRALPQDGQGKLPLWLNAGNAARKNPPDNCKQFVYVKRDIGYLDAYMSEERYRCFRRGKYHGTSPSGNPGMDSSFRRTAVVPSAIGS